MDWKGRAESPYKVFIFSFASKINGEAGRVGKAFCYCGRGLGPAVQEKEEKGENEEDHQFHLSRGKYFLISFSKTVTHKDMTTCQRVLLKLGTTHPASQINWVWYQSAVCVLIFKKKTTSPNWTGDDLHQSETSSHDSRVMARLPFFLFLLLWTNEKRLLLWLCRTGSSVYHMRSLW